MFSNTEIGIDLGTTNILLHWKGKGIVFNEPAVIAVHVDTNEVIAIGNEAKDMVGKTPANIEVIRPIKNGVISDYQSTTQILKALLKKSQVSSSFTFRKPSVVITVPTKATPVEKRAIVDAVKSCGIKQVHILETTISAAIGSDLPVEEPAATMIIDIGGGTTEVAIISYGGVVACNSINIGGNRFDEEIIQYIRKHYNLLIGHQTAEHIKVEIGNACPSQFEHDSKVPGRDLVTSLPKTITISSKEIYLVISELLNQIIETIHMTLEECPPELSGDIVERGVTLTGGGSLLNGLKDWLSEEIHLPVQIAPSPLESVAIGTGKALSMIGKLQKTAN